MSLSLDINSRKTGLAVIGMSGRFPNAASIDEFWRKLRDGDEMISAISETDLARAGMDPSLLSSTDYVGAEGCLESIDFFDAGLFNFHPRDAESMDPQVRLLMECAWTALEHAGYQNENRDRSIGIFAGGAFSTYMLSLLSNPDYMRSTSVMQILIGNDKDHLTSLISYKLDLKGPALTVQTTCSTSLVSISLACQSLLNYQCDLAIAGGVRVKVPHKTGYLYDPGGMQSPDGHCRTFDKQAQGTVFGSGVGLVVLKRLAEAIEDRDHIHAVVRGFATNSDGALKVGYTAPSVQGQAEVIAMAQAMAGVEAETIGYVEAHGTGTRLGDPIEVAALTQAFRASTNKRGFCALGSVKTNIGHLDTAAGVAGFIKTVLSLEHGMIPASLHYREPNPEIDFASSPFFVNDRLREWRSNGVPRRAGVSSFGIGGTNAHVVLEEAPARAASGPSRETQLLVWSAQTGQALENGTQELERFLGEQEQVNLADLAYTYQTGRRRFAQRRMLVCHSREDALEGLRARGSSRVVSGSGPSDRAVVFLFSGQGAQYGGMGEQLYRSEEVFRRAVEQCGEILQPHLGQDIREVLYGGGEEQEQLQQTRMAQPGLFVVEYALAQLWMSWGVTPKAMMGHSIGEYVAACVAGVMTLPEALWVVSERGRLMQAAGPGAMLAVSCSEAELRPWLGGELEVAAVNGPGLYVVSGPTAAIEGLEGELSARGVGAQRLRTSHAFHSRSMEGAQAAFAGCVAGLALQAPRIPFVSNVSGTWITAAEATSAGYWADHLRRPVQFARGMETMLSVGPAVLLEVGPGQALSRLAAANGASGERGRSQASLPGVQAESSEQEFLLEALGRLWLWGVNVNWKGFTSAERRQRIVAPTYVFDRQRYWVEPAGAPQQGGVQRRAELAEWFWRPVWRRAALPQGGAAPAGGWLILAAGDGNRLGNQLQGKLQQRGAAAVVMARQGSEWRQSGSDSYQIDADRGEDYERLLRSLASSSSGLPSYILQVCEGEGRQQMERLLMLAQAWGEQQTSQRMELGVITSGLAQVTGSEAVSADQALLLGPCRVIPQEYAQVGCRLMDVERRGPGELEPGVVEGIVAELSRPSQETVVAWRNGERLVENYEPVRIEAASAAQLLRPRGVYLITGGYGGIGGVLAESLARAVQARLVLVGRSGLPGREHWPQILAQGKDPLQGQRIAWIERLEQSGGAVLALEADAGDLAQMEEVVRRAEQEFGVIHGIIHAAGVAGGSLLQWRRPEQGQAVLRPKLDGARVLGQLFAARRPDWMVLCSSLSAVLGGMGQVDYCAANAFLDSYAAERQRRTGQRTLAINWDTWQQVGMAVNTPVPKELEAQRRQALERGIRPEEGVEAFARMVCSPLPQIAVSTSPLLPRIEAFRQASTAPAAPPVSPAPASPGAPAARYPRPALQNPYVAPRNSREKDLAEIWQDMFGMEQVGVEDDFFELGGHSLLAIQLTSRIRSALAANLSPRAIFDHPSVAKLAEHITQTKSSEEEKLASVLKSIEDLSDEDLNRLLGRANSHAAND